MGRIKEIITNLAIVVPVNGYRPQKQISLESYEDGRGEDIIKNLYLGME